MTRARDKREKSDTTNTDHCLQNSSLNDQVGSHARRWRILIRIGRILKAIFNTLTRPLNRYSEALVIRLPLSTFHFRVLYMHELFMALGLWEPYVRRIMKPKEGDIVLDIGAHIGYYTLNLARQVGPRGIVVSVEPDPYNYELLLHNVKLAKLDNVQCVNYALSSKDGTGFLNIAPDHLTSQLAGSEAQNQIKVDIRTIDSLCMELGLSHIDWIKIDIELGVADVLKGGQRILKYATKMIVEIHTGEDLDALAELGYRYEPLLPGTTEAGYYFAWLLP